MKNTNEKITDISQNWDLSNITLQRDHVDISLNSLKVTGNKFITLDVSCRIQGYYTEICNNIALLAGFGKEQYNYDCSRIYSTSGKITENCRSKTIESFFFGCRYFFYNSDDKIRPIISLTWGRIGKSIYDAYSQGDKPKLYEGMRFGVGGQWMGKKKKFGLDAEIHKNITGHHTEAYSHRQYNGWRISYSLKYAF